MISFSLDECLLGLTQGSGEEYRGTMDRTRSGQSKTSAAKVRIFGAFSFPRCCGVAICVDSLFEPIAGIVEKAMGGLGTELSYRPASPSGQPKVLSIEDNPKILKVPCSRIPRQMCAYLGPFPFL